MKIYLKTLYFTIAIIFLYLALAPASRAQAPATTGYIWGRVMMPDDATGIAGCEVQLLGRGDQLAAQTTTDADGNFIFTNLDPNGDTWGYRLVIRRGSWGQSVSQQFSVFADSATRVVIRVYPFIRGFSLTGDRPAVAADGRSRVNLTVSLLDVDGRPVPDGVHVKLAQEAFFPNPGRFFAGAENGTELTLATSGGKITAQYGDVPGDALARGVRVIAAGVEAAESRTLNLTIDLVNPNAIEGTVYDATGRPVPFALVCLYRWDGVGRYAGYNSTEAGDRTDGRGACDAAGRYRFEVMPAGDYRVNATESTFSSSARVTVVRGTYALNVTLPMGRGSIRGWVRDGKGNAVPGATVSLLRVYGSNLSRMATNGTGPDGGFGFSDVWYGKYDVQAVHGNQTADLPLVLDENRTSVTLTLLHEASLINPTLAPTPEPAATPTPKPAGNATATPRPPTPTPPPVTPMYLLSSYGVALAVMVLVCAGILFVTLRLRR